MTGEEILQIFFAECDEALDIAEAGLAACHAGSQNADTINAIFRAIHSIKGGASAFGFPAMQAFAHEVEALLSDVREGLISLHGSHVTLLLRAIDTLGDHVAAARANAAPPADAALTGELVSTRVHGEHDSALQDGCDEGGESGEPSLCNLDLDALLDELMEGFNTGKADPDESFEIFADEAIAPVPAASAYVEGEAAIDAAAAHTLDRAATAQSIRIDLPRLDALVAAVGELVIAQAMMAQRLAVEGLAGCEELAQLEGLTREIQADAMAIRAQPIGSVFSRVPRLLRELGENTGKHVRLEVSGEATELDRTVIERLSEPLTHLIRNAIDHGIEGHAERLAAGKDAEGTLRLSAEHRSDRILLRIADDGRGIDRQRVLAKAIEKGIVSRDAQLSEEEIDNLIFHPGFSTSDEVSRISGRGVGMDVVRQNVRDLGGRITIESTQGKGTTFMLALPLTLAVADGMIVNVGQETLVVPVAHIVECIQAQAGLIHGIGARQQMLDMRGRFIPIISLRDALDVAGECPSPEQGVLIVVETEAAGQAALLVDEICDQRQFVIKGLDSLYRPVQCAAGATILGDGRIALILDVDGLVTSAGYGPERHAA